MTRNIRNLSLAQLVRLRREAVRLKIGGLDYIQIGRELDITTIAARDLCMQHQQLAKRQSGLCDVPRLPHRVIQLFLNGRYADFIGQTVSIRAEYLADIASLYLKSDLLCEQGIGRITVARIEQWLAARDRRFRAPDETVAEVICRFRPRPAQSAGRRVSCTCIGAKLFILMELRDSRPDTGRMKHCARLCHATDWRHFVDDKVRTEAPNSVSRSAAWSLSKHPQL